MGFGTIFDAVALPVLIFIVWIGHKRDVPKWSVIAMLLTTLLIVAEESIEMSKRISYDWKGILLVVSLVWALVVLGIVVRRMVQIYSQ